MATPIIRTTYALDAETVERLDRLARQWKLSRSAALRKLIREREPEPVPATDDRLQALRELQEYGKRLGRKRIEQWVREIREERIAGTERIRQRWKDAGK